MSGDITLCNRNPSTKLDVLDNERIIGVALLSPDGVIVSLPCPNRHYHIFRAIAETWGKEVWLHEAKQGFTTSQGRFVDRKEGRKVAEVAGQIIESRVVREDILFSEDVW